MRTPRINQPLESSALAALELNSIAVGIEALDSMLKEAPVKPLWGQSASPGKYLIMITASVEDLQRSLAAGLAVARDARIDELLLPTVAPRLQERLTQPVPSDFDLGADAIAVIETYSAPSLLGSVDTALKTGETRLAALHLLQGIGGKSTATITGDVESVRMALRAGADFASSRGCLAHQVLIPRPDPGLTPFLASTPADR